MKTFRKLCPLRSLAAMMLVALGLVARPAGADSSVPGAAERSFVAERLVKLGRGPDDAAAAAALLTPEDLRVLLANPDMLQAAGVDVGLTILLGVLIFAALVAIAAAGDGFVFIGG